MLLPRDVLNQDTAVRAEARSGSAARMGECVVATPPGHQHGALDQATWNDAAGAAQATRQQRSSARGRLVAEVRVGGLSIEKHRLPDQRLLGDRCAGGATDWRCVVDVR